MQHDKAIADYKIIPAMKSFETVNRENVITAYAAKIEEVRMRLEALTAWADEMGYISPDMVQWPNVGSAGHVAEKLAEVMAFLGIK